MTDLREKLGEILENHRNATPHPYATKVWVNQILQAIEEAIAPPGKLVPYTRKQDTFAHGYNAALAEIKEILRS